MSRGQVLFIDARNIGRLIGRTLRVFDPPDIDQIVQTFYTWRGLSTRQYRNVPGFCHSAHLKEIEQQGFLLTPGRYVGATEHVDESDERIDENISRLHADLVSQFRESDRLERLVLRQLDQLDLPTAG